jgi:WD40 repeat protein
VRLPDGRLVSAAWEGVIRLWDVRTEAETARPKGHAGSVEALCVLADGRLASGSWDKTIRLWDVKTGIETARLKGHLLRTYKRGVDPMQIAVRGRGFDASELEEFFFPVTALCLLPDERLASGSKDIRLWDVTTGGETACLKRLCGEPTTALCVLPDGRLASASGSFGSQDNKISLWETKTSVLRNLFRVVMRRSIPYVEHESLEGHSNRVTALCLLPDGRLASGSWDKTIRLWDVKTGIETARLEGHSYGITALCSLTDGRLASGSSDHTIRLWDVKTGVETARLKGDHALTALCLLRDGRLVSGYWDRTIRVWDIAVGREIARLEIDATVTCFAGLSERRLVAGDQLGRLHWLDIVD